MPIEEGQNLQSDLRQSQMAAMREPPKSAPAEEDANSGEDEGAMNAEETLETPGQERAARASLMGKKAQIMAQKTAAKATKATGRAGQAASFLIQRAGSLLVSFGLGTGITIIGLIIGLPLLIIGVICLGIGLLVSIGAKATVLVGETMEKKAKVEEKKLQKEQGGKGILGAAEGVLETADTMRKYAAFIAGPFIYIGCTFLGLLSGFIFLAIIVGGVIGAAT
jgi:hypothetical protein